MMTIVGTRSATCPTCGAGLCSDVPMSTWCSHATLVISPDGVYNAASADLVFFEQEDDPDGE